MLLLGGLDGLLELCHGVHLRGFKPVCLSVRPDRRLIERILSLVASGVADSRCTAQVDLEAIIGGTDLLPHSRLSRRRVGAT